jgi:hypothetical protein
VCFFLSYDCFSLALTHRHFVSYDRNPPTPEHIEAVRNVKAGLLKRLEEVNEEIAGLEQEEQPASQPEGE